jgi:DNA-binding MarR family transcriptional regulator
MGAMRRLVNIDAIASIDMIAAMPSRPSEPVVTAWVRLIRAQRAAFATVETRLKEAGMPGLDWYDVLLELERAGTRGLRPFELQKSLLFAQYNLSRLVDRMSGAGHVARKATAEDGRGHRLTATASGRALRRRMWPIYSAAIEEAVGRHLSEDDARSLGGLLHRLYLPTATEPR